MVECYVYRFQTRGAISLVGYLVSVVTRFVVISVSKIERYRTLIFKLRFIAREFAFYHLFVHALNSDLSNAIKKKLTPLDHRL